MREDGWNISLSGGISSKPRWRWAPVFLRAESRSSVSGRILWSKVCPGGILLWRLQTHADEKRERLALKLVGVSFLVLAFYVAGDAAWSLIRQEEPEKSWIGIVLSIVSLIVMLLLARAKRRVAARLKSRALHADSRQTDICAHLSAILLVGLLLNALFGWWWADSVAALLMAPIIFREGLEAFAGDKSCTGCFNGRSLDD